MLPTHRMLGLLTFYTALAAVLLGLLEKLTFMHLGAHVDVRSSSTVLSNVMGLSVLALGATVALHFSDAFGGKAASAESESLVSPSST